MQLRGLLPLVVTLIIALPFHQVLKLVVAHPAVQYVLDLILDLTVNESWGVGVVQDVGQGWDLDALGTA
jgi:hypothetical protein